MQSKATCARGWTSRPLMLLYGFLIWAPSLCNGLGYHLEHLEKHARPKNTYARLIGFLFFFFFSITNQDCILIIQNIGFPKILRKPKLRWQFGIKCRCQLTFTFVFKNVTWHFGFEVECRMKFVKHRHWWWRTLQMTSILPGGSRYVVSRKPKFEGHETESRVTKYARP